MREIGSGDVPVFALHRTVSGAPAGGRRAVWHFGVDTEVRFRSGMELAFRGLARVSTKDPEAAISVAACFAARNVLIILECLGEASAEVERLTGE